MTVWADIDPAAEREQADAALRDLDFVARNGDSDVAYCIARGFVALVHELRAIHGDDGRTVSQ